MNGDLTAFDRLSTPPDDPDALFRDQAPARKAMISAVLARSVQYAGLSGREGVTAWFDPFTDIWFVARWRPAGRVWRMLTLGIETTDGLSSARNGKTWVQRGAGLEAALKIQGERGRTLFHNLLHAKPEGQSPDPSRSRSSLDGVIARESAVEESLDQAARKPGYAHYRRTLGDVLVRRIGGVSDAGVRQAIVAQPGVTRIWLQPVEAFERRRGGETFAVQSPLEPAKIFAVHLTTLPGSGEARPVRVGVVDLFAGAS